MRYRYPAVSLLLLVLALTASCAAREDRRLDLRREPPLMLTTDPFAIGDHYTLGMTGADESAPEPIRITMVEVLHSRGVEVVGVGVQLPDEDRIGLVPGWPPEGYQLDAQDEATYAGEWHGP